ncbi:hypothetical protein ACHAWF_003812 [Thalassiosira exigua]
MRPRTSSALLLSLSAPSAAAVEAAALTASGFVGSPSSLPPSPPRAGRRTPQLRPVLPRAIPILPLRPAPLLATAANATDVATTSSPDEPLETTHTALSTSIDELGSILGGRGQARLAWDCYREGVDPSLLFGPQGGDEDDEFDSALDLDEYRNGELLKRRVIPMPRRSQPLGGLTLGSLSNLNSHCGGSIEGGLGKLVDATTSADGTTKLLVRFGDGLPSGPTGTASKVESRTDAEAAAPTSK